MLGAGGVGRACVCVCVSRLNPGQLQSDDPPDRVRNIHHPDKEMVIKTKIKRQEMYQFLKKSILY